jgi:hypothetical protein
MMPDFVREYHKTFESSTTKTPEFIDWAKKTKKWFAAWCKKNNATLSYWNVNHFEISGMITLNSTGNIWYFNTGDVRFKMMKSMLVRTAKHLKDWTGGRNQFANYTENFEAEFSKIVADTWIN